MTASHDPLERARARLAPFAELLDGHATLDDAADALACMEGLHDLLADNDGDAAAAALQSLARVDLEAVCLLAVAALEGARRHLYDRT